MCDWALIFLSYFPSNIFTNKNKYYLYTGILIITRQYKVCSKGIYGPNNDFNLLLLCIMPGQYDIH